MSTSRSMVTRPTSEPDGTCDWGGCDQRATTWRRSEEDGWLPVCDFHESEKSIVAGNDEDERDQVHVHAVVPSPDEVRVFYEVPLAVALRVRALTPNVPFVEALVRLLPGEEP